MAHQEDMAGQEIIIVGMISSLRKGLTRNNKPFVSAVLEDISGEIEITAWSEVYERTTELWEEGNTLLLCGKIQNREDRIQLTCKDVVPYETGMEVPWNAPVVAPAPVVRVCQVHINTVQTENKEEDLSRLRQIFALLPLSVGKRLFNDWRSWLVRMGWRFGRKREIDVWVSEDYCILIKNVILFASVGLSGRRRR